MNNLTTLQPPAAAANSRNILAKNGFACALVTIEPGEQLSIEHSPSGEEHLLFVVEGEVTIRSGEINTMLNKNEAHLLPKAEDCTIEASAEKPAKLLRVDVPPRQIVEAPIFTVDSPRK